MNTVMGCRPVSSRLVVIRLRASPFNIIIKLYRPTPLLRSMMVMQLRTSMTTSRKAWTSPLRRTSLLCLRLERQSRRGCIQELERHLWTMLQPSDKRERSKAPGVYLLQRSCVGECTWQTQSIQKMDMAQPKWRIP